MISPRPPAGSAWCLVVVVVLAAWEKCDRADRRRIEATRALLARPTKATSDVHSMGLPASDAIAVCLWSKTSTQWPFKGDL